MNVLKAINPMTWVNKAIDKRIAQYERGVHAMEYNPLLTEMTLQYDDKHMTRRTIENALWYQGNEQDLAYFYRREAPKFYRKGEVSESMNYFWATTKTDIRKIHTGIPQLISEKMVDLIVGNGYEIKVEGTDDTENENELQEALDEMLDDNKFNQLLGKGIETESWSGGTSWKITLDPRISEYPIFEVWEPENYTNVIERGRIVEDIFYTYYKHNRNTYRLSERYGVDKKVGAYIDYELHQLINETQSTIGTAKWISVALTELEETQDLQRFEIRGYFKRLSLYKPNKLPNSEFRHSFLGESDYAGSYGAFDALDEIASTWIQEFRDGKLNRYFPEELLLKDTSGNYIYPDDFKKDHILYADSPSENMDKQKIQYAQGQVNTDKHVQSWRIWLTTVLNNAGFSPLTVGVTGLEAIDASSQSQQEREKVSIRTRNKKIGIWTEFLQDFLKTALEIHWITRNMTANADNTYSVKNPPEFDLIVTFADYIVKSKNDRTTEVQLGLGTSWDILGGVQYVHDDLTEREQLARSARIKLEQGYTSISQAELSALQAENLDTNEIIQEQGVEILPVNENINRFVTQESDTTPPPQDQEE